jgi:hypothetical protein
VARKVKVIRKVAGRAIALLTESLWRRRDPMGGNRRACPSSSYLTPRHQSSRSTTHRTFWRGVHSLLHRRRRRGKKLYRKALRSVYINDKHSSTAFMTVCSRYAGHHQTPLRASHDAKRHAFGEDSDRVRGDRQLPTLRAPRLVSYTLHHRYYCSAISTHNNVL